MDKHKILAEAKAGLESHVWGTFVEGKASVALGVTVSLSPDEACRKRLGTTANICDILLTTCCWGFWNTR